MDRLTLTQLKALGDKLTFQYREPREVYLLVLEDDKIIAESHGYSVNAYKKWVNSYRPKGAISKKRKKSKYKVLKKGERVRLQTNEIVEVREYISNVNIIVKSDFAVTKVKHKDIKMILSSNKTFKIKMTKRGWCIYDKKNLQINPEPFKSSLFLAKYISDNRLDIANLDVLDPELRKLAIDSRI